MGVNDTIIFAYTINDCDIYHKHYVRDSCIFDHVIFTSYHSKVNI